MAEHYIHIKSIQEWTGSFGIDGIGTETQMDMDMHIEKSISFTCECGEKFYKRETAEKHLKDHD